MSRTKVSPANSITRDEVENAEETKKPKTRRPPNTAFRQQRLKSWQPILTPKTVLPMFFLFGVIFAPIGGLLLYASEKVQEISIDYTDCTSKAPTEEFGIMDTGRISSHFSSSNGSVNARWKQRNTMVQFGPGYSYPTVECQLMFTIPNDIGSPVLLYYRLTKFYQNHRRYVKSLDQDQLKGKAKSNSSIDGSDCAPLGVNADGKAYYPCGLIANSLFNDTIHAPILLNVVDSSATNRTYNMTNKGIAWDSDASLYKQTEYKHDEVVPPPNWAARYPYNYTDEFPIPNLGNYEEFQVWMRTAGLPTFSKPALRNDNETMTSGTYLISIDDYFPVHLYGGTKEILISTRTVIGGKNTFLGIAYIVVGGLCLLLGAGFTAMTCIKPRKLGDHTYLTWNNEQPAAATTSGRSLRPNEGA